MTEPTLVYSGRMTNWPVLGAGIAGGVALAVLGRPWEDPWPAMVVMLSVFFALMALAVMTSTSLRVTSGGRGVQVRWGIFGWSRFNYPRERIAQVDVVHVSPWNSWEYGMIWTPRAGWTFVLRSGPAMRLTLTNRRRVTVGVTDPNAALAALGFDPAKSETSRPR